MQKIIWKSYFALVLVLQGQIASDSAQYVYCGGSLFMHLNQSIQNNNILKRSETTHSSYMALRYSYMPTYTARVPNRYTESDTTQTEDEA